MLENSKYILRLIVSIPQGQKKSQVNPKPLNREKREGPKLHEQEVEKKGKISNDTNVMVFYMWHWNVQVQRKITCPKKGGEFGRLR